MHLISGVPHERTRRLYAWDLPRRKAHGETVQVYVAHTHPLLQRKRALLWEALCEVMTSHWRRAGKNTDGRPGLPWAVALYVLLIVLMLVKDWRHAHGSVRGGKCRGTRVHRAPRRAPPQIRDHANIARAYAAWGQEGVEENNALILHVAKDWGFADIRILSSDTTAQELLIGYPNEPGILRGVAQRCGRALAKLRTRAVVGVETALVQVQTILRSVKEHHLFAKDKVAKRQILTRMLTEVGQLVVHTRAIVARLRQNCDRVTRSATATLGAMHEVARRLITQIVQWITTGVVAQGKMLHAGTTKRVPRAQQGREKGGVWPAVSPESPRWGVL